VRGRHNSAVHSSLTLFLHRSCGANRWRCFQLRRGLAGEQDGELPGSPFCIYGLSGFSSAGTGAIAAFVFAALAFQA
jgi:hypothetical protein